jgi:hypothetical protein
MRIDCLWFTQRSLRRFEQITVLIALLTEGGYSDRIELARCEDGEIEIRNGHHRVVAIWLSGRRELRRGEYLLIEAEKPKNRFGKIWTTINQPLRLPVMKPIC